MELARHSFQQPLNVAPSLSNVVNKTSVVLQQQSVIQPNQHQLQHQLQTMHDGGIDGKRREILARRPSYRRILDDLAGDGPVKMENYDDTGSSGESSPNGNNEEDINGINQSVSHQEKQYQSIHLNGIVSSVQGGENSLNQLHDSQPGDNQYIITTQGPDNKIQAYTIKGTLPIGLDNTSLASPHQLAEEATRKRELRLYKNREAARECRRKKKEYVKCLENRVAVLENQNKALIEELKSLKDLYCSKGD
uniref:Cyclic AMP-responsive element-binding protein n=1 Tax=Hydra viridissima TaxID=6082 RepID=CREB_HYDVD|nr:RecName: Full=Cyclic AMP-responsive element-binding protein; Short=cAMP-responsive element-binding protein; AltName: Full=cAMP response element-binding protein [Hydra viridissima]CAA58753.1 cAMP response element binding protein [Hydra viridissima]